MLNTLLRLAPVLAAGGALWRRKRRQALLGVLAIIAVAGCAGLAVAFAGWALFSCLAQSMSSAAAAGWVAALFALAALAIGMACWLNARARRRRTPDYAGLLAALAQVDIAKPAPGTLIAGGLVLGVLTGLFLDGRRK